MIYICGDSFSTPDTDFADGWMTQLSDRLPVTNLSVVSASNLLISMQVDQAIKFSPDYIILQCTSSTRSEIRRNRELIPFSWLNATCDTTDFTDLQLRIIQQYFTEFFDLDVAIYNNQCIIENTLHRLQKSGIPFCFDQGGFEHPSMGSVRKYFTEYNRYRSNINLWDYTVSRTYRPYYHITDPAVHKKVNDYYYRRITNELAP